MEKKGKRSWLIAITCLFALWAVVPQANAKNAGAAAAAAGMSIYDGEPTEADCRMCHDDLVGFPMLLASNPDRHHAIFNISNCLDCHLLVWNDVLEADVVSDIGNCLGCHDASTVVGAPGAGNNVHHETKTYYDRDCVACHK